MSLRPVVHISNREEEEEDEKVEEEKEEEEIEKVEEEKEEEEEEIGHSDEAFISPNMSLARDLSDV